MNPHLSLAASVAEQQALARERGFARGFGANVRPMRAFVLAWTRDPWRAIDSDFGRKPLSDDHARIVLVVAAVCLVLPRYFGHPNFLTGNSSLRALYEGLPYPTLYPRVYWALFKVVNYFLLPALTIRFVLGERIRDYGFKIRGHATSVWLLYVVLCFFAVLLAFGASHTDSFVAKYPKYADAGDSMTQFLVWEVAYGFQFLMLEFFFRGFLLFSLARRIGSLAVFVAVVPYAMIHLDKPILETLGSIVTGVVLGTLALRTRSIWGGVFVHTIVAWSMDLFAMWQKGQLPFGRP